MMKTLNRKGFTLIELLVAVLVIGIISALVYPKFGPVKERTYVAAMKNTLNKAVTAEENYMDENDVYAPQDCGTDGTCSDDTLGGATGFAPDDDVGIVIVPASGAESYGFVATATHAKTATSCEIEYGSDGTNEFDGKITCS